MKTCYRKERRAQIDRNSNTFLSPFCPGIQGVTGSVSGPGDSIMRVSATLVPDCAILALLLSPAKPDHQPAHPKDEERGNDPQGSARASLTTTPAMNSDINPTTEMPPKL